MNKKTLQSSLLRALVALAIGVLLIKYPDNTVTGITIAIGVMFLLSGLVSLLTYWSAQRHAPDYTVYDAQGRVVATPSPAFPLVGIGSLILGCILALMPTTFVSLLMYVIGSILVLGAINQFLVLIGVRRYASVGAWFWLCPSLTLIAGLFVMVKPLAPMELAMTALGWLSLFYGVTEMVSAWKLYRCRKQLEEHAQQDDATQLVEKTE